MFRGPAFTVAAPQLVPEAQCLLVHLFPLRYYTTSACSWHIRALERCRLFTSAALNFFHCRDAYDIPVKS